MQTRKILVTKSANLTQVEGFPENCERSVKGAIHIRPNTVTIMTLGELEHIKQKYPVLSRHLIDITPISKIQTIKPASWATDSGSVKADVSKKSKKDRENNEKL